MISQTVTSLSVVRWTQLLLAASLGLAIGILILRLWPPLNGDAAAILSFAQRMVQGERLYRDLIDVNPPVIFWLSLPPAAFAALTGLGITSAMSAWTGCLIVLTAVLALRVYGRPSPTLVVMVVAAVVVLASHNHSQREHQLVILTLPWLAGCLARVEGRTVPFGVGLAAGLVAAIGIAIKPYFVLPAVAVELGLLAALGSRAWLRRPELLGMTIGGVLLVTAVLAFASAWLTEIAPLVARHYASTGWDTALEVLISEERPALALVLGLLTLHRRARVPALFGLGALAGAMVQGKGWDYHLLPAWAALLLALGVLFDRPTGAAFAAIALALTVLLCPPLEAERNHPHSLERQMTELLRAEADGGPVLWLTSSIWPHFPAVLDARVQLAGPYMNQWLLQALYRTVPLDGEGKAIYRTRHLSPDEADVRRHMTHALLVGRPTLILVAPAREEIGFAGQPFDYLDWLAADPAAAEAIAAYHPVATIAGIRVLKR